jgi:pimeloyl-ACP methyl ester carboxylesterase
MEQIEIDARGMTFRARTAGPADGRPVLLLHGFPQTSASWRFELAGLAQAGYRAVAFDQRGYSPGARPEGVDSYKTTELVADVLALADALGIDRFDLAGHDWGGAVAWLVAGSHPGRLRTLTVVSTPHPAAFRAALAGEETDQRQRSSYIDFFRQPEAPETALLADDGAGLRGMFEATGMTADEGSRQATDEYVRVLTEPGAMTAALNWYRAMGPEGFGAMGPVTTPTMYVWSTEDIALGRDAAEATARHVQGPYRFEVLEGVSHWIPEEAAPELTRLLLDHLEANAPAGR